MGGMTKDYSDGLFPLGHQEPSIPNSSHLTSPNSVSHTEAKSCVFVIQIKYHLHYILFFKFHQRHKVRID